MPLQLRYGQTCLISFAVGEFYCQNVRGDQRVHGGESFHSKLLAVVKGVPLAAVASAFTWFDVMVFTLQPERISGEQYGIHADVWSVGISFMEVGCSYIMLFFFF